MNFIIEKMWTLPHILTIVALLLLFVIFFFALRKAPKWVKFTVIYILILFNLFQHLFKFIVWPQFRGLGFDIRDTPLNFCACLEFLLPIFYLQKKDKAFKASICCLALTSGFLSIISPVDYVGKSILTWQYAQYFVCHGILFLVGALSIFTGMIEFKLKNFWKVFFVALLVVIIICLDNFLWHGIKNNDFNYGYQKLIDYNPLYAMGPYDHKLDKLWKLFSYITPKFLLGANKWGKPIPILWYSIPLFILVNLGGALIFGLGELIQKRKEKVL